MIKLWKHKITSQWFTVYTQRLVQVSGYTLSLWKHNSLAGMQQGSTCLCFQVSGNELLLMIISNLTKLSGKSSIRDWFMLSCQLYKDMKQLVGYHSLELKEDASFVSASEVFMVLSSQVTAVKACMMEQLQTS